MPQHKTFVNIWSRDKPVRSKNLRGCPARPQTTSASCSPPPPRNQFPDFPFISPGLQGQNELSSSSPLQVTHNSVISKTSSFYHYLSRTPSYLHSHTPKTVSVIIPFSGHRHPLPLGLGTSRLPLHSALRTPHRSSMRGHSPVQSASVSLSGQEQRFPNCTSTVTSECAHTSWSRNR